MVSTRHRPASAHLGGGHQAGRQDRAAWRRARPSPPACPGQTGPPVRPPTASVRSREAARASPSRLHASAEAGSASAGTVPAPGDLHLTLT